MRRQWFLRPGERGNPGTDIARMGDADGSWVEGNLVRPLIHGATYLRRLLYWLICDPDGRPRRLRRSGEF
jgi:hypothetical protein